MITEIQQITESNPGGANSNPALIRAGLLLAPPGLLSVICCISVIIVFMS